MTEGRPRLFFMQFWANDDAAKLAGDYGPRWTRRTRKVIPVEADFHSTNRQSTITIANRKLVISNTPEARVIVRLFALALLAGPALAQSVVHYTTTTDNVKYVFATAQPVARLKP